MYLLLLLGVGIAAVMMANRGLASPSLLQAWPASTFQRTSPQLIPVTPVGPGGFVLLQDTAHGGTQGGFIVAQVTGNGVSTIGGNLALPGIVVSSSSNAILPQQTVLFDTIDVLFAAPDLASTQAAVPQF